MTPTALPALITPFDRSGSLDLAAHRSNIGSVAERGFSGVLLAGSTGQGPLLEPGERATLTRAAREAAPELALMVGIMAESTSRAIALAEESAAAGADEILVLPPVTLGRNDVAAQERYLVDVADASPVPVLAYSVPRNTGYHVDEELLARVARHPNIVGLKDSGGDVDRIARLVQSTPDGFRLYNGASRTAAAALAVGCAGLITASCNYAPDLIEAVLRGADGAQDRLTEVSGVVESLGLGGVTAAAARYGMVSGGFLRPPLSDVTDDQLEATGAVALLTAPVSP